MFFRHAAALSAGAVPVVSGPSLKYQHWWLPASASTVAPEIDSLFTIVLWITGIAFVVVQTLLVVMIVRYRRGAGRKAQYITGSRNMELLYTAVPAVILVVLALVSQYSWASLRMVKEPPNDAMPLEVLGEQFAWNFRYAGPDGQFGKTNLKLTSPDNPFGRDLDDPAGTDDIITLNEAHIPVNRPVEIRLRAKDVIHSFFVPEFRYKQDAVPGLTMIFYLTATKVGDYEIACAEFCGLGHYRMKAALRVGTEHEQAAWLQERAN